LETDLDEKYAIMQSCVILRCKCSNGLNNKISVLFIYGYMLHGCVFSIVKFSVVCLVDSTSNDLDSEDNFDRLRVKVIIESDLAIDW